eukprot:1082830-Heterocapsa_arctica.AAC.1
MNPFYAFEQIAKEYRTGIVSFADFASPMNTGCFYITLSEQEIEREATQDPERWFQEVIKQLLRQPSPEEMGIFRSDDKALRLPSSEPGLPTSNWQVEGRTWENVFDPDLSLHAISWKRDLEMRTMFDSTPLGDAWIRGRSSFLMAWMLTCTMLQAAYNIDRNNIGKTAPDIKQFQIYGPGRNQLTHFGEYMYEQMTLIIVMYLRTFLADELLTLPGWAGFMEQGHENQAWIQSPQTWNNGALSKHQVQDWPGGIDRVTNLIKRCETSSSSQLNTDSQETGGLGSKKITPAGCIALMSSQLLVTPARPTMRTETLRALTLLTTTGPYPCQLNLPTFRKGSWSA